MDTNPTIQFEQAAKTLTAQPHKNESLFDDAYGLARRATKSVAETVEEHPLITAGVIGTAVVLYVTRGRSLGSVTESGVAGSAIKDTGENASKKLAGQIAERDAVMKQVGHIPEVARPTIEAGVAKAMPEQFAKAAADYEVSLANLKGLPVTHRVTAGKDFEALAKEIMEHRAPVTGERLFPDTVAEEAKRLTMRNPGIELKEGVNLTVYAEDDLAKLAEKTAFKHVPQLGQFLKEFGVTEEQIGKALSIQKVEPPATKRLLGQILTDEGLATKEQVDAAFGKQGAMKKVLAEVRKTAGF